jgi:hypothetical protein
VAARNFHTAWIMRSMGEAAYREWYLENASRAPRFLYFACLCGETILTALPGLALICFCEHPVAYGIGYGIVAYAIIVQFYTSLSLWLLRKHQVKKEPCIIPENPSS